MSDPSNKTTDASAYLTWGSSDVQKKLDENAKFLKEWTELLDRTEHVPADQITNLDIQKHLVLRRKLHENLGFLAKIVQSQMKKTSGTDNKPSETATDNLATDSSSTNQINQREDSEVSINNTQQTQNDIASQSSHNLLTTNEPIHPFEDNFVSNFTSNNTDMKLS